MASGSAITSSDLLDSRAGELRRSGRKALVCYITAGHPDANASLRLMRELEKAGADVIEVGVPFSDPLADGPVIQRSSQTALQNGFGFERTLELVRDAAVSVPVVLMTYLNPVMAAGNEALDRAAAAGVNGILVIDLPVGADPDRERWLGSGPLAFVRLVAPTTPDQRMREIAETGRGFVYVISRLGVTGERHVVDAELAATVGRVRSVTALPIYVGFGISTPDQARTVASLADGVIVGSAIVRAAGERGVSAAGELAASMRAALDAS
jgi:tryptophan synthase alpha chain